MKHPSRAARRGETIITLLAVIAVASVLMGLAMTILVMAIQTERLTRQQLRDTAMLARLARQFRDDVHRAGAVEASAGSEPAWTFPMPGDAKVVYSAVPGAVVRTAWRGGKTAERESFALTRQSQWRIEGGAEGGIVRLIVERSGETGALAPGTQMCLEADLGRYRERAPEGTP